jgi:hypothetical protein
MYVKTKSGRKVQLPSDEEEAAIAAGIAADPDTYSRKVSRAQPCAYASLREAAGLALVKRSGAPWGGG